MERSKTRLMVEDNTIYEIDLECIRKKEKQDVMQREKRNIQTNNKRKRKQGV